MYRKIRFNNMVLLSGDCAYGRRLIVKMHGNLQEFDLNKIINPEEGC